MLANKGYDTEAIRARTEAAGAFANIPARRNRTRSFAFHPFFYRFRNLAERFFGKFEQARSNATRYDKRADDLPYHHRALLSAPADQS